MARMKKKKFVQKPTSTDDADEGTTTTDDDPKGALDTEDAEEDASQTPETKSGFGALDTGTSRYNWHSSPEVEYNQARQEAMSAHLVAQDSAVGTSKEKVRGAWLKKAIVLSLTDCVQIFGCCAVAGVA